MDDKKVEPSPSEWRRIFIIFNREPLPKLKANRFKMGAYLQWAFRLKRSLSALFKMGA